MSDSGILDNENDVEIIYSDLHDTDNPLSSIKSFEELNMSVTQHAAPFV